MILSFQEKDLFSLKSFFCQFYKGLKKFHFEKQYEESLEDFMFKEVLKY